jgi:organic hydroperoxide reductase OsmC/OhrA
VPLAWVGNYQAGEHGEEGFGITVALAIHLPGNERATAEELVHRAHQVCPYSNATRGNIDVLLTVA